MPIHKTDKNRFMRQISIGEQAESEQVYKTDECRADYYRYYTGG